MMNPILIPLSTWRQSRLQRVDASTLFGRSICLLWLMIAVSASTVAQTSSVGTPCAVSREAVYTLNPPQTLTNSIKGDEKHVFSVTLTPGQYLQVVVEQKGSDLSVAIIDPNKLLLVSRDNLNGKFGPERISVKSTLSGRHQVEVCAGAAEPPGSYQLIVEPLREATPADEKRSTAELLNALAANERSPILALKHLTSALNTWRELGETHEEGYALLNIGEIYRRKPNFSEAKAHFLDAAQRLKTAGDWSGQASALNQLGAAYRDLDDAAQAPALYLEAIQLRTTMGDRWGLAQLFNNLGLVYSNIGDPQKAVEYLDQAHTIWREFGADDGAMNTVNNLAKANLDRGYLTDAFRQCQEVLVFCTTGNRRCPFEPHARNTLGVIYDTWSQPTDALSEYEQALGKFRDQKDAKNQAIVRNNIGMALVGIGDAQGALNEFRTALKVREELGDSVETAITRSNIGYALTLLGRDAEALEELQRAVILSRRFAKPAFEAYTLMRIGLVHVARRELQQALSRYREALAIQKKIDDNRGQAITLDKIGDVYRQLGLATQAMENYRAAITRWQAVRDVQGEALTLYGIAQVERNRNNLTEARNRIVEAVTKVESVRTQMTSHRLRLTYHEARQDYYQLEIDIRMRLYEATGSDTELRAALFASERARARSLLDLLTESHAGIRRGVDPELLARERNQRNALSEKRDLLTKKLTAEQRTALEQEIHFLERSFDQTQSEIRRTSPAYASLTQPRPLNPEQLQQLLDDNTVLLQYSLGEQRSYLWLVSRNNIAGYSLAGRARIEDAVEKFRDSITAPEPDKSGGDVLKYIEQRTKRSNLYEPRAFQLSNMVLGPVASKLENKRLVIVADGSLHYVPFGALPLPVPPSRASKSRGPRFVPLLASNETVYEPSASVTSLIRAADRSTLLKTVAVLADPVFDKTDSRAKSASDKQGTASESPSWSKQFQRVLRDAGDIGSADGSLKLERLRYSGAEADAIVSVAPAGSAMKAVGFDANRATAASETLKEFRIVHFATHGILNTKTPELSGLVLSLLNRKGEPENGFLKMADIYNLNLPVDLVVLSACQTGMGKTVRGEGLIGLTRGFIHAGTRAVVASLWKVEDEITADLMKTFYSYMLEQNMPPAAALRRAQLDIMNKGERPAYFWAGFVMQGEWK